MDYTQVIVTAKLNGGAEADVTRMTKWTVTGGVGEVSERGLFTPVKNGQGKLTGEFSGKKVEIAVKVAGLDSTYLPDYLRDVTPVVSKLGCNAGTCHGSKDGERLQALPVRRHLRPRGFTDDMASRRQRQLPRRASCLKATGSVPHEGKSPS